MSLLSRSLEKIRREGIRSFISSVGTYLRRVWKLSIVGFLYGLGSGHECNICGWEGSKFVSFGAGNRPNAKCPRCQSKERQRLQYEYIRNEVKPGQESTILYVAPMSRLAAQLRENGSTVITTDLMKRSVDCFSSLTHLPFFENQFDLIICSHVLEHVPDDDTAISELHRTLTPGGTCLILVPQDRSRETTYEDPNLTTKEERKEAYGRASHVRWYGNDVVEKIEESGLNVSVVDYSNSIEAEMVEKYRLKESDQWIHDYSLIFHCSK